MIGRFPRDHFLVAAVALGALVPAAAGAQTSATMTISAEILPRCTVAADAMAFGAMEAVPHRAGDRPKAAVTLDCTPGTAFAVTMDQGLHGERRMANAEGTGFLDYEIYQDAAATRPWGGSPASAVGGIAPRAGKIALTAYGRVFPAAGTRPGRYQDVITVLVAF